MELIHCDLQNYHPDQAFDFVICNPPFFSNHLASQNNSKQIAIHDDLLSPEQLAKSIKLLLKTSGKAMVLYPVYNMSQFEAFCNHNQLFINHLIHVYSKPNTPILRQIALISNENLPQSTEKIEVKNEQNVYSDKFKKLLQPYYLIFP
jgi:tRNA1Val (adenine37-N6)-methyltransferase